MKANARGEALGLTDEELAFYDALETNDTAVKVLGDDTLRTIAREPVAAVRKNVSIDWTLRENVRARLRVLVKRILRKHGYPPDKQEKATQRCWNRQRCYRPSGRPHRRRAPALTFASISSRAEQKGSSTIA